VYLGFGVGTYLNSQANQWRCTRGLGKKFGRDGLFTYGGWDIAFGILILISINANVICKI